MSKLNFLDLKKQFEKARQYGIDFLLKIQFFDFIIFYIFSLVTLKIIIIKKSIIY